MYYNTQEEVIQLFDDYATFMLKAKYRAMKGEIIKTSEVRAIKILPQNNFCRDYQYCLHKYRLVTLLKIF